MLPTQDVFKRLLPENFVYYRPRDIVSGDFYWLNRYKEYTVIAVGDCTGHGVPGAFMSVMGISFLNEIVGRGNFSTAAAILNQLRERVMKALNQTGQWDEQKDGMDISLCLIDRNRRELQYSGANNPLYLIRNEFLIEYKGDRMPIGVSAGPERSFTNHKIDIQPADRMYLFTDGYVDQFGGDGKKKYKYLPFKNLLMQNAGLDMESQLQKLDKNFLDWKGDLPQIDDILIMGFAPASALGKYTMPQAK
jgi:serine phosphatase RsbU (regulator of sigma subunit)